VKAKELCDGQPRSHCVCADDLVVRDDERAELHHLIAFMAGELARCYLETRERSFGKEEILKKASRAARRCREQAAVAWNEGVYSDGGTPGEAN